MGQLAAWPEVPGQQTTGCPAGGAKTSPAGGTNTSGCLSWGTIMSYPTVNWGLNVSSPFLTSWWWNITRKTIIYMSNWFCWIEWLPDGGDQWLLVKPWNFSIRQCTRYCTCASQLPSTWPAKRGNSLHHCFVACCAGGRQGNMEKILAQWHRPVTSMQPWTYCIRRSSMHMASHPCIRMVIGMAHKWIHLFAAATLFIYIIIANKYS